MNVSDDKALIVYDKVLLVWLTKFQCLCILLILLLCNTPSFLFVACCQHPNSYMINIITSFDISSFIYDIFHDVSSSDYIYTHIYVYACSWPMSTVDVLYSAPQCLSITVVLQHQRVIEVYNEEQRVHWNVQWRN